MSALSPRRHPLPCPTLPPSPPVPPPPRPKPPPTKLPPSSVSGHSGGYRVIAGILDRGGLPKNADEVWLFDALYGRTDSFLAWADRTHGRLLNIYTDHGGTNEESEKLQARLTARATPFLAAEETALTADALRQNQFVFIHTDLAHAEVADKRHQFALFLKTSSLSDR